MKYKSKIQTLAATIVTIGSLTAGVNAALTLTFKEVGNNVTVTASGTVNVSTATFQGDGSSSPGFTTFLGSQMNFAGSDTTSKPEDRFAGVALQSLTLPFKQATGSLATGIGNFEIDGSFLTISADGYPSILDNNSRDIIDYSPTRSVTFVNQSVSSLGFGSFATDTDIGLWKASTGAGDEGTINFRIQSIPEPSSTILLLLGGLGLTFRRSRH